MESLETQILDYLNSLVAADAHALELLLDRRFPCNERLAAHPTCQVRELVDPGGRCHVVGLLGVLAGLTETVCGERVSAEYDELGAIVRFAWWQPPLADAPDWRVGLKVQPKYRHDRLHQLGDVGQVQAALAPGSHGIPDATGVLQVAIGDVVVITGADRWMTA